jgi:hypothetical protein
LNLFTWRVAKAVLGVDFSRFGECICDMNAGVETKVGRFIRDRKILLLAILGFFVAVDLLHSILDITLRPFTGHFDNLMHIVLILSPIAYFAGLTWLFTRWVPFRRVVEAFPNRDMWAALGLIVLVAIETAYTAFASARTGSSTYHPLFPDLIAGSIIAVWSVRVGKDHLQCRGGRITVLLIACLWAAGSLLVDSLWFTEGTRRGVGPLWHIPLISSLITGLAYLVLLAGAVVGFFVNLPANLGAGSIPLFIWWAVLIVAFVWTMSRLTRVQVRVSSIALAASGVLLATKLIEWSAFVAD